jgi:hypothetical protein
MAAGRHPTNPFHEMESLLPGFGVDQSLPGGTLMTVTGGKIPWGSLFRYTLGGLLLMLVAFNVFAGFADWVLSLLVTISAVIIMVGGRRVFRPAIAREPARSSATTYLGTRLAHMWASSSRWQWHSAALSWRSSRATRQCSECSALSRSP